VVIVNADQFAMHQMVINVMEAARIAGFEQADVCGADRHYQIIPWDLKRR
jgi:biopolymer transport protein ExbD